MMKPIVTIIALPLLAGATTPSAKMLYDVRLTIIRDDAVLGTPRILAAVGKSARVAGGDQTSAWSVTLSAMPDGTRSGMADLSWTAQVAGRAHDGTQMIRRGAATIEMPDPGAATLSVGRSGDMPPIEIRVALASRTP